MTTQKEQAEIFNALHIKGTPVILFNIWDAGSARAVAAAGAKAIATGSQSVAVANGFADGQNLPMEFAIANLERIVGAVKVPVTIDFEGGYAEDVNGLKSNIAKVTAAGAIGINFEDQVVGGEGIYGIEQQSARIKAVRESAGEAGIPLFINARTDVFLKTYPAMHTREQLDEVIARSKAYAEAGASGLFAPGLRDPELIKVLCEASPLPVNIMVLPDTPTNAEMAALGVSRISYGPGPFRLAMSFLTEAAGKAFES